MGEKVRVKEKKTQLSDMFSTSPNAHSLIHTSTGTGTCTLNKIFIYEIRCHDYKVMPIPFRSYVRSAYVYSCTSYHITFGVVVMRLLLPFLFFNH